MSKMLIALGGNALGETPREQKILVKDTAVSIVDLIERGHQVVVVHGNGPQVGMIHQAMEYAAAHGEGTDMPFPECGAMSQGYIGYHLQNAIDQEMRRREIYKGVASIVTQVVVNADDPAFSHPTKPVGGFYSEEEARRLETEKGFTMVEDSGRGYRRVVPSPQPERIVEKEIIETLLETHGVVIAAGGGGIPVIEDDDGLTGVSAVIDKDAASNCLAQELDLDYLFMLTAVERVAVDFNTPNQRNLDRVSVDEARSHIAAGQFPAGSMLPKVEAAIQFVESSPGRRAIIGALEKATEAINGQSGTTFFLEESAVTANPNA